MKVRRAMIELYVKQIWHRIRAKLFPPAPDGGPVRVCVVVPSFPSSGGIMTVLKGIASVTQDVWHIEYLAQFLGPDNKDYIIHQFGSRRMTPLYFPFAWLYVFVGIAKFLGLMRRGARYHLLLPQDGVFSGALAGVAGKLTGVRVVCIDHAAISLFTSRNSYIYREERIAAIATKKWPQLVRFAARSLLIFYWPSKKLAAHIAARCIDHYVIPGVPGDSIEEGCNIIGIPIEHVTRFNSMIDLKLHSIPDQAVRSALCKAKEMPADAIIVAIVSRLAPEKSLDIALECIDRALAKLTVSQRKLVRVVIAGDGSLRKALEQDVQRRGLEETCLFWGELPEDEVLKLLGVSDIFLYTSMRGACMPMAVLEAMASSCAVIASTEPIANAILLADDRGIVVPAGDIAQTSEALFRLLNDVKLCNRMGMLAREYIHTYHSSAQFRHTLLQTTKYTGQNESATTVLGNREEVHQYATESKDSLCHY